MSGEVGATEPPRMKYVIRPNTRGGVRGFAAYMLIGKKERFEVWGPTKEAVKRSMLYRCDAVETPPPKPGE